MPAPSLQFLTHPPFHLTYTMHLASNVFITFNALFRLLFAVQIKCIFYFFFFSFFTLLPPPSDGGAIKDHQYANHACPLPLTLNWWRPLWMAPFLVFSKQSLQIFSIELFDNLKNKSSILCNFGHNKKCHLAGWRFLFKVRVINDFFLR